MYDPDVRSVRCYVATGAQTEVFQPPVVPLGQSRDLALEFDVPGDRSQRLTPIGAPTLPNQGMPR